MKILRIVIFIGSCLFALSLCIWIHQHNVKQLSQIATTISKDAVVKDAVVKDESVGTEAHSEEEEPNTTDLDENIVLHLTNDPSITFGISCLPTLTKDSNGYRCTKHGELGEYEVSVFGYDGLDVYYCARCDVDVIRQILDQHIVGIKEE